MRGGLLAAAAVGALMLGGTAGAETLREALIQTYNSNPTIMSQRAQLRATDEGVALARSQGRPQLSGTGGLNQDIFATPGGTGRTLNAGVDVS